MTADLLLASQNPGKLAEMRQLLAGLPFRVLGPARRRHPRGARGDGQHLHRERHPEGALLRAGARAGWPWPTIPGLSVDALDGGPGLYSSRFGGEGATDDDRNRLLLEKLARRSRRAARRALHERGGGGAPAAATLIVFQAEETVEGRIADAPRGPNGFGYDPSSSIRRSAARSARSPPAEKDRVSHRGKAFARLREFLRDCGR